MQGQEEPPVAFGSASEADPPEHLFAVLRAVEHPGREAVGGGPQGETDRSEDREGEGKDEHQEDRAPQVARAQAAGHDPPRGRRVQDGQEEPRVESEPDRVREGDRADQKDRIAADRPRAHFKGSRLKWTMDANSWNRALISSALRVRRRSTPKSSQQKDATVDPMMTACRKVASSCEPDWSR